MKIEKNIIFIILFFCLIILFGCGTNPVSRPPELRRITLQLRTGVDAASAGYYIAQSKGFYFDEGLEVRFIEGDGFSRPEEAVLSGRATFGIDWLPRLMILHDRGEPVVHLGQIFQSSGTRFITKKAGNIQHPVDLINRRVGLFPEGYCAEFYIFLGEHGISAENIRIADEKDLLNAFLENKIEFVSLLSYDLFPELLSHLPEDELLIYAASNQSWGLPQDAIFTTKNTFSEQKELCRQFIRASIRGWEYVLSNPRESIRLLRNFDRTYQFDEEKEFQSLREIARLILREGEPEFPIGRLTKNEFDRINILMNRYGLIRNLVPADFLKYDILEQ